MNRSSGLALRSAVVLLLAGCGLTPPPPSVVSVTVSATPSLSGPGIEAEEFSQAEQAALRIRNIGCGGVATGSGFAIDEHILVTNRHVVGGAADLEISTYDGRDIEVTATGSATIADLAVVMTDEALPETIGLAASDPEVGDEVTAVGYPLGGQLTTTQGHVLRYAPDPVGWSSVPMILNDAPIEHGSSGSPLLNTDGDVVGIVYATEGRGRQYAVPVEVLNELINSPEEFDKGSDCNGAPEAVVPSDATRCTESIYAGDNTSCPFALNVAEAWLDAGGGEVTIEAHSPVTNLDYTLECGGGRPVVCVANTGATVYIK